MTKALRVSPSKSILPGSDAAWTLGSSSQQFLRIVVSDGITVGGNSVLGPRGASVANATDAASAITQLNLLLARLRAHGLIAP
jgi:hypothetical protein